MVSLWCTQIEYKRPKMFSQNTSIMSNYGIIYHANRKNKSIINIKNCIEHHDESFKLFLSMKIQIIKTKKSK